MTTHPSGFGDMDPEAFRREAHRVADWIADYLAGSERYPVLSRVAPGEIAARAAPRTRRSRANRSTPSSPTSSACSFPASRTGTIPASSPTSRSPAARPACSRSSCRPRSTSQAMLWRTSPAATELEEVALGWLRRLLGLPDAFEGVIYDTASISTLHALAAARERRSPTCATRGLAGRGDVAPHARLLLGARALVGRQGGHPARPRARVAAARFRADAEFRMRAGRCSPPRSRRTAPPAWLPLAVVATVGTHVDDERRSGAARSPTSVPRVKRSGCTSTPRTPASRRWCRSTTDPPRTPSTPTRSSSIRTSGCSRRSISARSIAGAWTCVRAAFSLTPEYLKTVGGRAASGT